MHFDEVFGECAVVIGFDELNQDRLLAGLILRIGGDQSV